MNHNDRSIHVSGSVTGNVASGDNVTLNYSAAPVAPPTPLTQALNRVEELLETHRTALPEAVRAERDFREFREEVESDDPDIPRRDSALSRLTHRVASVTPLLSAVESVNNLLS